MLGVTGLAIWLSLATTLDKQKTTWQGLLLYRFGQGLIGFAVALVVVGFVTVAVRGVWLALGGQ
jgi:hypothetical protein